MASNAANTSTSAQRTRDDGRVPLPIPLDRDFRSDRARRPVAWSRSCVQFYAHDSQAQVVGCVCLSPHTFVLPIPQPIFLAPLSYGPPTILVAGVPLRDEWECLFAYFPPRPGGVHNSKDTKAGGVGCVYYNPTCCADVWTIAQYWPYQHNDGAVAARWLHEERQWACQDGQFARMPRMGPQTPLANPVLAVVTQSHALYIYSHVLPRGAKLQFGMIAASLKAIVHREENQRPGSRTAIDKGMGLRLCKSAAIGMGYNEESIIVAMHSALMPSCPPPAAVPFDSALSTAPTQTRTLDPYRQSENEIFGDESSVDLCEVRLLVQQNPASLSMQVVQTFPLTPISNLLHGAQLTNLTFVPRPPAQAEVFRDTRMFLAVASVEPANDSYGMKSRIALYAIQRNTQGNRFGYLAGPPQHALRASHKAASMQAPLWVHSLVAGVEFTDCLAVWMDVCDMHNIYVAAVAPTATYCTNSAPGAVVGETVILQIPGLTLHPQRRPTPLFGAVQRSLITLPLATKLSTNEVLVSSVPPGSDGMTHHPPTIHPFPSATASHAQNLACALIGMRSCRDVVHALRSQPLSGFEDTLVATAALLDAHSAAIGRAPAVLQAELVRAATEAYHRREDAEARYKAGLDLCYLLGAATMFDACEEGDDWDFRAVWELAAAMQWVIGLVEQLARQCVYLEGERLLGLSQPAGDGSVKANLDLPPPTPKEPHPSLFLLLHPFPVATLLSMLKSIERFHAFVTSSQKRTDNAYIARQSVIDCMQRTPLNISALKSGLEKLLVEVEATNPEHLRRTLGMLAPSPELYAQLPDIASRLTSSNFVDKSRLFYESTHSAAKGKGLLSVLTHTPLSGPPKLHRVCMGCSGRAQPFAHALVLPDLNTNKSVRLEVWLKQWNTRCLCGGHWAGA